MSFDTVRSSMGPELAPWLAGLLFFVLAAATLEGLVQSFVRRRSYDWRAYGASLADAVGRRAVDAAGLSIAAPVLAWAHAHRVDTIALSTPAAFALLFVGQEFCYYWYHRAAHRVRWFWATHAVHHSPNELTLAAALRLGWTGKLTGTALFFAPLVWLGFPPLAVLAALAANLLYQFWLHAPWMPRLGPLEWIFNTPTHHKVHHASNPEYLDRNYGGVLIVFDRLFGTFVQERADVPIRYGLTTPLRTHNPLRIAFHEWGRLGRDLWRAKGWGARISILLGPPGVSS
ncbi:sterol desaturase family protein [Variovorax paradoxus]|uniref:Fatty acid hydroxylase superfamily protein n=1 Tax=Variovorax paradoxus TaxID=34073 RepID=A0A0H2M688_VARPD|nr:sterol desaturase family protein [Variovorax paradoxus]KLN52580.1 fatty acid hydroxylase superfamily protein [Variovorax paradoxus]